MDISASNLDGNSGAVYKESKLRNPDLENMLGPSTPFISADKLIAEYREIQRQLSIPENLRLPSVDLLFNFISGINLGSSVKLDGDFNHAYLSKRPKYADGLIFLINAEQHTDSVHKTLDNLVAEQFRLNPDFGKILSISLKTDSLTDILASLAVKPKTASERDSILKKIKTHLEIGATKTFYPPHKKYYENHIELIMSKLFKSGFKRLERISKRDLDLFIYQINHNKHLILDFEDLSRSASSPAQLKEEILADLQKRYPCSVILELKSRADKPIGHDLLIADYEKHNIKKTSEIHLAAYTSDNFYQLKLKASKPELKSLMDNEFFAELETEYENYLPEANALRGEKILAALFTHLNTEAELMSQKPGHRYDIKVRNKEGLKSPLKLLNKSKEEILLEVKTAIDDYPSIRSLTVNQALRFNNLKKNQQAIVAKLVLSDLPATKREERIKIDDLFKNYPPKLIENEDGFALLKPDLSKSKDRYSLYNKIYLFDFNELKSKTHSSETLSSPATISHLKLSLNVKALREKILKAKGKEIDLSKLPRDVSDLERAAYFTNLKKLKSVENSLKSLNNNEAFNENGFAAVFTKRNSLIEERTELMQNLLITQLRKNSPFPNLQLSEFPSRLNPSLRSSFTTVNPDVNEHIFVFKHRQTGEIKPYELMFFSEADPSLKLTQSHLLDRDINFLEGSDPLSLPVRIVFYDAKANKMHLIKESLPEKLIKNLAEEFSDLSNVKKGVHYIKDSLFRSIEPISLHLRPEKMLRHSFR